VLIREVSEKEKNKFNQVATHPLQSWEWGKFREKTGKKVIRLGVFEEKELKAGCQLTVHPLPKTNFNLLYFPKGPLPSQRMLKALAKLGQQEQAILIKMEPNVGHPLDSAKTSAFKEIGQFLLKNNCRPGRPLFTPYTFQIDLTKKEEALLAAMKSKTRYNLRLAQRHGVEVVKDNSPQAFETYLKLMIETTRRQKFFAHTPDYHRQMWEILNPAGMAHLLLAKYKGETLVAWILFTLNHVLYYPYGGSTRKYREVMPSYAMMWEAIKFGQKMRCTTFDLWGTPGPNPDPKDPWYGFHHFKEGFGAQLIEFLGTWDLVINPYLYPAYNLANGLRWKFLRLKSRLI
jgi:lipid II:glycine glycyltransferase (peptidoglycan interpeptide bridge formation enzyme)